MGRSRAQGGGIKTVISLGRELFFSRVLTRTMDCGVRVFILSECLLYTLCRDALS